MAEKGNLYLDNRILISLYEQAKGYEPTYLDALYSQYKTAYKISLSNHFRGTAADEFKNYISKGVINIISGLMDLTTEMSSAIQLLAEVFYQHETSHEGKVDESALDYINNTLCAKEGVFDETKNELNAVLGLAAQYISTQELSLNTVNEGYKETRAAVTKIREDLYLIDDEALIHANELYARIINLKSFIEKIMAFCYNDNGDIDTNSLNQLQNQNWFQTNTNVALHVYLNEDPFEYSAGEVTVAEDQWAIGLCSDVYAYTGYSFLSVTTESGEEDGNKFAKGKAAVLSQNQYLQITDYIYASNNVDLLYAEGEWSAGNGVASASGKAAFLTAGGYAQFTDYLRGDINANVLYADGEVKIGDSEDYYGFKVKGEAGVAKADGTIALGTEDLNAFIKADAKVLCADGKVAYEFEDDGEFAIGIDGLATAASASLSGGTTLIGYKNKDMATGKENPLLGFKLSVSGGATAGGAIWAESETAIEGEYVNINATTLKIKAEVLLGVNLTVTIPTPYFKWPW